MADFTHENDMKFTSEEVHRLSTAFKDKEFLKLFQDYVEDINSEDSKRKYEEEIILLEKERGYDVKFILPSPCYVMKFILNAEKFFINICTNQNVGKCTYKRREEGTEWKIPVILSKPREDTDMKGSKCLVYDVLFHLETIELALKNQRFRGAVEDTALSTISENFGTHLDLKTAKYLKMKYKGKPPQTVMRRKIGSGEDANMTCEPLEEYWKRRLESDTTKSRKDPLAFKTPKYSVKYRDIIDMKDFSTMGYTDKSAPKEIIVEIILPDVKKASDVELDVSEKKLTLNSCQNLDHRYKLVLDLSYAVKPNDGTARFDKTNKKLTIALPLKDREIPAVYENNNSE